MKISALIQELQRIQAQYGDVDVLAKNEVGSITSFDHDELYIDTDHKDGSVTVEIDA